MLPPFEMEGSLPRRDTLAEGLAGIRYPRTQLREGLNFAAQAVDQAALELSQIASGLRVPEDTPEAEAIEVGQEVTVRSYVHALRLCPEAGERAGTSAEALEDLLLRDMALDGIVLGAERIKGQALDAQLAVHAFGSYLFTLLLTEIKGRIEIARPEEREALLADFANVLSLLGEAEQRRAEEREAAQAERARAEAEAAEAEDRMKVEQARSALRLGEKAKVDAQALREAASLHWHFAGSGAASAPTPNRGRARRR